MSFVLCRHIRKQEVLPDINLRIASAVLASLKVSFAEEIISSHMTWVTDGRIWMIEQRWSSQKLEC